MKNDAKIESVCVNAQHVFSKTPVDEITLLKGLGVEGDAHCGEKVKHRSRVKKNPDQPNLRQVHLLQTEVLREFRESGYDVDAGDLGENITTRGIDLLSLPKETVLHLGEAAEVVLTGLRNPCAQIDTFKDGLMADCFGEDSDGKTYWKTGVMAVVKTGGVVRAQDEIRVTLPDVKVPLEKV